MPAPSSGRLPKPAYAVWKEHGSLRSICPRNPEHEEVKPWLELKHGMLQAVTTGLHDLLLLASAQTGSGTGCCVRGLRRLKALHSCSWKGRSSVPAVMFHVPTMHYSVLHLGRRLECVVVCTTSKRIAAGYSLERAGTHAISHQTYRPEEELKKIMEDLAMLHLDVITRSLFLVRTLIVLLMFHRVGSTRFPLALQHVLMLRGPLGVLGHT